MIAVVSYADDFAKTWGRRARETFLEVAADFGMTVDRRRDSAHEWGPLGYRGGMYTTGRGGPLTGRGFRTIVIDDPIKNAEEAQSEAVKKHLWDWFRSTVMTRLAPNGCVVVMNTRWATDDLTGRLLTDEQYAGRIRRVRLPALAEQNDPLGRPVGSPLWPERYDKSHLESIRGQGSGDFWWQALYQQRPTQHEAAEWPESYFGPDIWSHGIAPDDVAWRVLSLDPSLGRTDRSDFSAFVLLTVGHDGTCHVDADIARRDVTQIVDQGLLYYRHFRPDVFACEVNGFAGLDAMFRFKAEQQRMPPLRLARVTQHANKLARIRLGVGPYLASRRVTFRDSPGARRLVSQLREFPLGDHDDGPDALETALRIAEELSANGGFPEGVEEPERIYS